MSNVSQVVGNSWYAVKVRPNSEFSISNFFSDRLGIKTAVPGRKVWKRRNGKRVELFKPLLSSYVFISANIKSIDWKLFFTSSGVHGLVKNNGAPASIPSEQMESLEILGNSDAPIYEVDYFDLKPKDRVEVVGGPLFGAVGNYVSKCNDSGKFVVKLDLFKRALVVELESDLVRPF